MQREAKMEIQASLTTTTPKKGQRQYRLFVSSASSYPWGLCCTIVLQLVTRVNEFLFPFCLMSMGSFSVTGNQRNPAYS